MQKLINLRKSAFTLAETLIVIAIIGVIATLTIPNLNQSTDDREKVAKLKKVYATLDEAFGRAESTYGEFPDDWFVSDTDSISQTERYANRLKKSMKLTKDCGKNAGCYAGVTAADNIQQFILADGAAVYLTIDDATCKTDEAATGVVNTPYKHKCGVLMVDLDGTKGKNIAGIDQFKFIISSTGIIPAGGEDSNITLEGTGGCFSRTENCTAWVVYNENLDYMKAASGVCTNGNTLNWTDHRSCD